MKIKQYLDASPAFNIVAAEARIQSGIRKNTGDDRMSFLHALALLAIYFEEAGFIRPKDLADELRTSRSHLSHILSALEGKKQVKRSLMPGDARAFKISLTEKGKGAALKLIRYFDRIQRRTEEIFTETGTRELAESIERVATFH